jgi:SAM-dependent methyltransferase
MELKYREVNRKAWAYLARNGCDSSQSYGLNEFRHAREYLDSRRWIPWARIRHVLCLASGGGQQAPLFASLGYRVVSADISPEQLRTDKQVADQFGWHIECVSADMLDLSQLYGRDFDLVYQAVSACYIPDVRRLYKEVARVLRPRGYYYVEHWNPTHLQLADENSWTGDGYLLTKPLRPGQCVEWTPPSDGESSARCFHFMHSLSDLIGSLCEAGFRIVKFGERSGAVPDAEPGTHGHLAAYLPPFFSLFAQRSTEIKLSTNGATSRE